MPIRPDVGDDIEFLDEIPVLPVVTDDELDQVDTEVDDLAEWRAERWFLRDFTPDVRGEAA